MLDPTFPMMQINLSLDPGWKNTGCYGHIYNIV